MMPSTRTVALVGRYLLALVLLTGTTPVASWGASHEFGEGEERVMSTALVIERVGTGGRTLIQTDAVDAVRVAGWKTPGVGDELEIGKEVREWDERSVGEDGWMRVRAGGYVSWTFESPEESVMILEASGHTVAFVNGEPRTGDPYEYGYVRLPVLVKMGVNEIMLKSGRGRVRAKLTPPTSDVMLNTADMTLPDLIAGEEDPMGSGLGSIVVMNATTRALTDLRIRAFVDGEDGGDVTILKSLPPLSVRKVAFRMRWEVPADVTQQRYVVMLTGGDEATVLDQAEITLQVRRPTEKHKRTFISEIDGSVQYYAVVPPPEGADLNEPKALILSLHGASVEATNQANCYKQRDWCYVICPTNRRPFGFDWEDWGRADALEVLAEARARFNTDQRRTYLTGHSMGGHGTWNIGVQFPGTFAALGPSAGWISFWTYAGGAPREGASPIEEILFRAAGTSDTLAMKQNFASQGIYILHGDADDNVPVAQARTMREELGAFHPDFAYYEEPGAGHWWGDRCVDWDPMIEFFRRHALPEPGDVRRLDVTTVNPAVSSAVAGVRIEDQTRPLMPSRIRGELDAGAGRYVFHTENVRGFRFHPEAPGQRGSPATVEIDGETVRVDGAKGEEGGWLFSRASGGWQEGRGAADGGRRVNLFKSAFDNRVVLVYATGGTAEEDDAAFAKARYDAETFWYRGNGDLVMMSDAAYVADRVLARDAGEAGSGSHANVILYGNSETNLAWSTVLEETIVVRNGVIRAGARELHGDDLACLFVAPMRGEEAALVGVVGSTGMMGARLTDQLPYFVSGVGIPEFVILHPALRTQGVAGVRAAGFFGENWTQTGADAVWAD